jgi:serine protease Do
MRVYVYSFALCLAAVGHLAAQQPAPEPAPPVPPRAPQPAQGPFAGPFTLAYEAPRAGGSYLGVGLAEIDAARAKELGLAEPRGAEITNVQRETPAAEAGLQRGDVVLEFNGQTVVGVEHFVRLVRETPVGREAPIKVLRAGAELNLTARIGPRKSSARPTFKFCNDSEADCAEFQIPQFNFRSFDFDIPRPAFVSKNRGLGVEMEDIDGQLAQYFGVKEGILVRSVDNGSAAGLAGLQAGDVVVSVAGKPVQKVKDVSGSLRTAQGDKVAIEVMRNKAKHTLQLVPRREGAVQKQKGVLAPKPFVRQIMAPAGQSF